MVRSVTCPNLSRMRSGNVLYVVQVQPNPGVNIAAVQQALGTVGDWYRIAMWCWLIDTDRNANQLVALLGPFVEPNGESFVSRIHPVERQGYKTQAFWNWIDNRS
jgi:hypothetical protein